MTKTFDEMMKLLEEKGVIAEEEGKKLITEHGPLTDDEKKDLAAAIKMKKALSKPADAEKKDGDKKDEAKPAEGEKKDEPEEVSMDDYLQALSVLDSDAASKEDKEKAEKVKAKFEGG